MDIFGRGRQLLSQLQGRAAALEERIAARRALDLEAFVAELRATLSGGRALRPLAVEEELLEGRVPLGLGRVQTAAFEDDRLRKVVLSHIALKPVIEGFALTLIPRPELGYPIFAADLMALPVRVSLNADVYALSSAQKRVLEPLWPAFEALGAGPGPLWAAQLGSGRGLHARLAPQEAGEGFAVLVDALRAYLEGLDEAGPGSSAEAQGQFFQAFHEHGPRKGPLGQVMGREWAERYSRLVFS